jgi:PTS system nitrogen regulatory IIA component
MNPVGELLQLDDVALDLEVATGGALLQRIAAMLARRGRLAEAEVLSSLKAREELGSTALGHGIAIPHARMADCGAAAGALVRTKFGIPFNAPDGKPVSVFLGLIVPKQANERHLKLLATAAGMFSERSFRERVRACVDPAQALELLAAWPDSPTSSQAVSEANS